MRRIMGGYEGGCRQQSVNTAAIGTPKSTADCMVNLYGKKVARKLAWQRSLYAKFYKEVHKLIGH